MRPQIRPLIVLVILAVALVAAAGCHANPASATPWTMTLTTTPAAPGSTNPTQFTLKVTDTSGQPVAGATAGVDLVMDTMDMGPNHVKLAPQAGGVYTGSGTFSMSGPWHVDATVTDAGHTQEQSFPVKVN